MTTVAIVGGGIGGVTAAIALRRGGIEAEVYEQASAIGAAGGGLGLFPNALSVLEQLGCGPAIEREGCRVDALNYRRWRDGRLLGSAPFGDQRPGMRPLTFHRADLLAALLESLPAEALHLNRRLAELREIDDRVELIFDDGERREADVVVGADGIRSAVGREAGLTGPAQPSGFAAYRGLVPAARLDGIEIAENIEVWLGPGRHFAHYWVSDRRFLNVIGYVPASRDDGTAWAAPGDPEEMRRCFAGWDPHVDAVLAQVEEAMLFGLYDRIASESWSKGRIALLGDAAHPMLPFFAQGGAQAVEDAATLGVLLEGARPAEVPARLAAYSRIRFERARRVQEVARHFAKENNLPDGPHQSERDARLSTPNQNPFAASSWLYDFDVIGAAREEAERLRGGDRRAAS